MATRLELGNAWKTGELAGEAPTSLLQVSFLGSGLDHLASLTLTLPPQVWKGAVSEWLLPADGPTRGIEGKLKELTWTALGKPGAFCPFSWIISAGCVAHNLRECPPFCCTCCRSRCLKCDSS